MIISYLSSLRLGSKGANGTWNKAIIDFPEYTRGVFFCVEAIVHSPFDWFVIATSHYCNGKCHTFFFHKWFGDCSGHRDKSAYYNLSATIRQGLSVWPISSPDNATFLKHFLYFVVLLKSMFFVLLERSKEHFFKDYCDVI